MSDVVDFRRPTAEPSIEPNTFKSKFGNDAWLLELCAEWRECRAQMEKNWAVHQRETGWGTLPDKPLDREPLDRMQEIEWSYLSQARPRTALLACELLGIALTILAHEQEEPGAVLSQGPVLDIVRNVRKSLEYLDGDMKIVPANARGFWD